MEAENSRSLPSECWKTRKVGDIIQFMSEGLRTRGDSGELLVQGQGPENQRTVVVQVPESEGHRNQSSNI